MNLYINDQNWVKINVPYNYNTTFNEVLEIISCTFPEYNICP